MHKNFSLIREIMVYLIMTQTVPEILKDKVDKEAPYPYWDPIQTVLVDEPDFDNPNTLKLLFSTIRKLAEYDHVEENNVLDTDFPYYIDWCIKTTEWTIALRADHFMKLKSNLTFAWDCVSLFQPSKFQGTAAGDGEIAAVLHKQFASNAWAQDKGTAFDEASNPVSVAEYMIHLFLLTNFDEQARSVISFLALKTYTPKEVADDKWNQFRNVRQTLRNQTLADPYYPFHILKFCSQASCLLNTIEWIKFQGSKLLSTLATDLNLRFFRHDHIRYVLAWVSNNSSIEGSTKLSVEYAFTGSCAIEKQKKVRSVLHEAQIHTVWDSDDYITFDPRRFKGDSFPYGKVQFNLRNNAVLLYDNEGTLHMAEHCNGTTSPHGTPAFLINHTITLEDSTKVDKIDLNAYVTFRREYIT